MSERQTAPGKEKARDSHSQQNDKEEPQIRERKACVRARVMSLDKESQRVI